jgi:hypothetical protein
MGLLAGLGLLSKGRNTSRAKLEAILSCDLPQLNKALQSGNLRKSTKETNPDSSNERSLWKPPMSL